MKTLVKQDAHLHGSAWQTQAGCRRSEPAWFFATDTERASVRASREAKAKAVCLQCPVLQQCRAYALTVQEPWGIWGALTEDERRGIITGRQEATGRQLVS
jgi:WhiB family transcriptional regulator, redox-sensing transcriptional regulator